MPGPTPLVPAPRISAALDIDVHLKLETANPTHSFKDRMAASAARGGAGLRDRDALLRVDREPGCSRGRSLRGRRARRRHSQPGRHRRAPARVGDLRRQRLHGAGHVRALPSPRAAARAPLPVGIPRRQPASVRGRGDQDDRVRDRRATGLGDARRGRQPGRFRHALREAGTGLRRARRPRARDRRAAADLRRAAGGCPPVAAAWADERPPSR